MRSYYVYIRTLDNQFFSCSVAGDPDWPELTRRVYAHFAAIGNPLPPASMVQTVRFVADPRNLTDMAGYEPVDDTPRHAADSYACYSEYEAGVTVTH